MEAHRLLSSSNHLHNLHSAREAYQDFPSPGLAKVFNHGFLLVFLRPSDTRYCCLAAEPNVSPNAVFNLIFYTVRIPVSVYRNLFRRGEKKSPGWVIPLPGLWSLRSGFGAYFSLSVISSAVPITYWGKSLALGLRGSLQS